MTALDKLFADISVEISESSAKLPPVQQWNPPLSGDIDILITRNGHWFHEGGEIKRKALVKLFASILKKEGDEFFLVTPVEKWRIRVEDVPFTIVSVDVQQRNDVQVLVFETSVGDKIVAGKDNPLRVEVNSKGEPSPYLLVRHGLEGIINRAVFYQLAELAEPGSGEKKAVQGVYSLGVFFPLE
ncbi:MAG: DUF1285 domain-containing protein [Porticoccaceae bacterium]|jgi:hypothetical protein